MHNKIAYNILILIAVVALISGCSSYNDYPTGADIKGKSLSQASPISKTDPSPLSDKLNDSTSEDSSAQVVVLYPIATYEVDTAMQDK